MARRLVALLALAALVAGCTATKSPFLQPGSGQPPAVATSTPVGPVATTIAATPTDAPTPDAVATPEITLEPLPTPESAAVSPAPVGYQQIVSLASGYAIDIPSTWIFVDDDSDVAVSDQVATLKTDYPVLAPYVDSQTGLIGQALKVVIFDPAGAQAGRMMTGNIIVQMAMPAGDLKTLGSTVASELKSMYKIQTVTVKTLTLPAGPAVELDYSMSPSGVVMKVVQYLVLAPNHTYAITLGSTSGAWSKYQAIFTAIAESLQAF
jgi:hypothetical protein